MLTALVVIPLRDSTPMGIKAKILGLSMGMAQNIPASRDKWVNMTPLIFGDYQDPALQRGDAPVPFQNRASRMVNVRNACLDRIKSSLKASPVDVVIFMDADVMLTLTDLASLAVCSHEGNAIVAPVVLFEREQKNGALRFYDTRGFVGMDRKLVRMQYPFFPLVPGSETMVELLSVGTVYAVPAALLDSQFRYTDIAGFTEHLSLCNHARSRGYKVFMCRNITVIHEDLTKYGEKDH